jgi:hypothetical protein
MRGKLPANEVRGIQELAKLATAPLPFAVLMADTSGAANKTTYYQNCKVHLREALAKESASLLLSLPASEPAQVKKNLEEAILTMHNFEGSKADTLKQLCCDTKLKLEAATFYMRFFKLTFPKDTSSFPSCFVPAADQSFRQGLSRVDLPPFMKPWLRPASSGLSIGTQDVPGKAFRAYI